MLFTIIHTYNLDKIQNEYQKKGFVNITQTNKQKKISESNRESVFGQIKKRTHCYKERCSGITTTTKNKKKNPFMKWKLSL